MKKVLIFVLIIISGFIVTISNSVVSKAYTLSNYTVDPKFPRMMYLENHLGKVNDLDLDIIADEAPESLIQTFYIETITYEGEVLDLLHTITTSFVVSGSDYVANVSFDFIRNMQNSSLSEFVEGIRVSQLVQKTFEEGGGILFYRVRMGDFIIYSGSILQRPEGLPLAEHSVEYHSFIYDDTGDYNDQSKMITNSSDKYIIVNYNIDYTTMIANINEYSLDIVDLTDGSFTERYLFKDIIDFQMSFNTGDIAPDVENIETENSYILLDINGNYPRFLATDLPSVNSLYEFAINDFDEGINVILCTPEIYDLLNLIDDPPKQVWIHFDDNKTELFDLRVNASQYDAGDQVTVSFIRNNSFANLVYETTITDDGFGNSYPPSFIDSQDKVIFNYDIPSYAVEGDLIIVTWIVDVKDDYLYYSGGATWDYSLTFTETYLISPDVDISASLNDGFKYFGVDNEIGGYVIVGISLLIVTILLAFIKASTPVIVLVDIFVVIGLIVMGLTSMWFNITFGAICISGLMLYSSSRRGL